MKNCPLCRAVYTDDTLNFCLNDGAELSADDSSAATIPHLQSPDGEFDRTENESVETVIAPMLLEETVQSSAEPAQTISSLPVTLPSSPRQKYQPAAPPANDTLSFGNQPPQFEFETQTKQTDQPPGKHPLKYLLFALPVLLLAAAGAWWIFAHKNNPADESNTQTVNSASNSSTANAETNLPIASPSSNAIPKTTDEINLAGTWTGTSGITPTTLIIEKSDVNNFSGTKVEGTWEAAFTGTIDPVSKQVVWHETKLLKGDSRTYSLGVNTGKISADGKKISGTGKDKFSKYPWTFSKR